MRLRSRGLGSKELVMDFREYELVLEGDELVVVGTIRDPVNWDFTIRVCEDDLAGLVRLILNPKTLRLVLRSLFSRSPKTHWSQARAEHVTEGKLRLIAARKNAEDRAKAAMRPLPGVARRAIRPLNPSSVPPKSDDTDESNAIEA